MEKLVVSNRIKAVAQLLERAGRIADIGCDHAYLSIYAIREKKAKSAIAMDVKEGPLAIAKENIRAYGMEDKIETRLSDGGKKLEIKECDSAVMAGMGGMLIERILLESLPVFYEMKQIILQPQSDIEHLREFLYFTGFDTLNEDMVYEDGKFYTLIRIARRKTKKAPGRPGNMELMFGHKVCFADNPVYDQYLEAEKKKTQKALDSISRGKDDETNAFKKKELEDRFILITLAMEWRENIPDIREKMIKHINENFSDKGGDV